ncbi:hypothetical protein BMS3Abin07_01665 [bacterium BMS3Abin07]|nr:hypothetical protein BMS3Abin07_01665 [bacterium BMS3Abin07]GBE33301.1 hypothetical protein BMS3Bbin05_02240 [bacterium BMS3Bbin05]
MKEKRYYKFGKKVTREIIGILMESSFYFDLTLRERDCLIKNILNS